MDMEILNMLKNRNYKRSFVLTGLLLSLILLSCRKKDATVKLPKVDPKLVVLSFISPQDSLLTVYVSQSQPLYNNKNSWKHEAIQGARVTIRGNGRSVDLVYDPDGMNYTADPALLNVTEGFEYTIEVSAPDGRTTRATTTIPFANKSLSYTYSPETTSITANWKDPAETKDYYRVLMVNSAYYEMPHHTPGGLVMDTVYYRYAMSAWALEEEFTGQDMLRRFKYTRPAIPEEKIHLVLLNVSKEYYEYGIKLPKAMVENSNPFQEATIMYTNMTNGFGVFAGFSSYTVELDL
jgi:hypothetical protein